MASGNEYDVYFDVGGVYRQIDKTLVVSSRDGGTTIFAGGWTAFVLFADILPCYGHVVVEGSIRILRLYDGGIRLVVICIA